MLIFFGNDDCITKPIFQSNIPPFLKSADKHGLKLLVAVVGRDGWNWDGLSFELLTFCTMGVVWNGYGSRSSCSAASADSKAHENEKENRKLGFH